MATGVDSNAWMLARTLSTRCPSAEWTTRPVKAMQARARDSENRASKGERRKMVQRQGFPVAIVKQALQVRKLRCKRSTVVDRVEDGCCNGCAQKQTS